MSRDGEDQAAPMTPEGEDRERMPLLTRVVDLFLRGDVAVLLVIISLLLGTAALLLTPREEEPQIVVPMADLFVSAPGLSAAEVEEQVTARLERLVSQIDGVEYVYSMSQPGQCIVTVRFYVGEDREDSLLKLYNKVHSNVDRIPPVVENWVVKPIEIDDVPIVIVTLWASNRSRYDDYELRRIAEQLQHELQALRNTNRVSVVGGRPRRIRVELDPQRLAARQTTPLDVARAIRESNANLESGTFDQQNEESIVEAGTFLRTAADVADLVVRVAGDRPVYLRDVARVVDGPAEVETYSWIGFGPAEKKVSGTFFAPEKVPDTFFAAVQLAVAKQKGTNAVRVAQAIHERMEELATTLLPDGIQYRITRDYGETANEKVNELVEALVVAVLTVIGLIGVVLGWRAALVIALTIPVCYSLTLFINLLAGYTINRVTMFALILSLGLLVDDPITDVENVERFFRLRKFGPRKSVLLAINEVRPALILSTLAIIVSFLPLVFITGMMGPYMAPMALNVPLTVTMSTIVAFLITPWASMVALRKLLDKPAGGADRGDPTDDAAGRGAGGSGDTTDRDAGSGPVGDGPTKALLDRASRAILGPALRHTWLGGVVLLGVALLLAAAMLVPIARVVPLKMLPYDNKNEFQVLVDMPEGTTLERTDAVARELGRYLSGVAEVVDFQIVVGDASPIDFNGMVRHYFLRKGSHLADIRVNLAPKEIRGQQSHEILLRIRDDLTRIAASLGADIKLVEVPPGPPVIATITAEVYGPEEASYGELMQVAGQVADRVRREPRIVDVDTSLEADRTRWVFETDKPKAALSGVSTQTIAQTLQIALAGQRVSVVHRLGEVDPLWIELRVPRAWRSAIDELAELYVHGESAQLVQLGTLGKFVKKTGEALTEDKTIYHKNLKRVAYVYGEVAGRPPAEAIVDMMVDRETPSDPASGRSASPSRSHVDARTWLSPGGGDGWSIPEGYRVEWAGEGEWKITLDVFRDLGLAFATAQLGIFVILMFQTQSRILPLVIMLAIPLTMIGIMPGFWLLNALVNVPIGGYPNPVFFTATAMIGMIALSGIVVRNSVVLIDFIHHGLAEGLALEDAILRSVAVRTRPILLTAGTTLLGNWVITLDPIFSGLAWAIIFGILTSTLFTLVVIPIVYWLMYRNRHAAGT